MLKSKLKKSISSKKSAEKATIAASETKAPPPRADAAISVSDIRDDTLLRFTIRCPISIVNGIRRVLISDIPLCVMRGFPYEKSNIKVKANNSHINNEILKHRMSCIPVMLAPDDGAIHDLEVRLNVTNTSEKVKYVTTQDLNIVNTTTKSEWTKEATRKAFPACGLTSMYIDILRLQPNMMKSENAEGVNMVARLCVSTAKEDSCFNATSTCSYGNRSDEKLLLEEWERVKGDDDSLHYKVDWFAINRERFALKNTYDFVLETACYYDNRQLMVVACDSLCEKLAASVQTLSQKHETLISKYEQVGEHCYNIVLVDDDYTVGKMFEYGVFTKHFPDVVKFCAYKKKHPMDRNSLLQLIFDGERTSLFIVSMLNDISKCITEDIIGIRRHFN